MASKSTNGCWNQTIALIVLLLLVILALIATIVVIATTKTMDQPTNKCKLKETENSEFNLCWPSSKFLVGFQILY